ncbi:MAG TPA: hypothetical protein VE982_06675 [Gaiellaceae bacterium]|nr:hypothetical protein [Gaiellaceae bacterium]
MLTPEVRAFAHAPDRYTRLSGDVERTADERVCVVQGTTWATVSGVRVEADAVQGLVDEVRTRVPRVKNTTWLIDPEARPSDLRERLLGLGLREPEDGHGVLHALACVEAPPPGARDVEVLRVETLHDYLTATDLMWDAFATSAERRERQRPHLRAEFEAAQRAGVPATFLGRLAGRPAGAGRSIYSDRGVFLIAGAVAEWARGRGVYRALVRARWDDAAARGTPALVVEALPGTSYPILKRVGFVDVCTIRRLEDPR